MLLFKVVVDLQTSAEAVGQAKPCNSCHSARVCHQPTPCLYRQGQGQGCLTDKPKLEMPSSILERELVNKSVRARGLTSTLFTVYCSKLRLAAVSGKVLPEARLCRQSQTQLVFSSSGPSCAAAAFQRTALGDLPQLLRPDRPVGVRQQLQGWATKGERARVIGSGPS